MIVLMSNPNTLLELIQIAPGGRTAVILPEAGIRVTYDSLREQVTAMADALASVGVGRGDRVATVLPNGLKIKYLRRLPKDPMTGKAEWGTRSSKDEPGAMFSDELNIFDVRSKSPAKGLNDIPYAKW